MLSTAELLPKVLLWTTCFPNSVSASASASASAASAACIYYVFIGGALRAPLYVHDKIHTAEAAEAEAAAAETELGKHVVHSRTSRTFGKVLLWTTCFESSIVTACPLMVNCPSIVHPSYRISVKQA